MWRAVHPSLTEERRVPVGDPTAPAFTLGFWPPLEAEKAKIYVARAKQSKPLEEIADAGEVGQRAVTDLTAFREMARFGVRAWSGLGDIPCATETITIDGREHTVLTRDSLDALYHCGLLLQVALECWAFNSLTPEEKKTSSSPSISPPSKTATSATAATRPSAPATNGAESSGSMAAPSLAARMS